MRSIHNRSAVRSWLATGVLASLALSPTPGWSQTGSDNVIVPAKDPGGNQIGLSDWTAGVVKAKGEAVPPAGTTKDQGAIAACRAAEILARRNLLETVKGMPIDSTSTVAMFVQQRDDVKTHLEGIIQATTISETQSDKGRCTVWVALGIHGAGAQPSIANEVTGQVPYRIAPPPAQPEPPPAAPAPVTPPAPTKQPPTAANPTVTSLPAEPAAAPVPSTGDVFTGLVIDARGLNAKPAMVPRILDEGGEQLYGSADVTRDYARQYGLAGYTKNLKAATENSRVTEKPLVLKAVRTDGPQKADMVLSSGDGARLKEASKNQSFLARARVMFVVD